MAATRTALRTSPELADDLKATQMAIRCARMTLDRLLEMEAELLKKMKVPS
jgi:hypothetical protein